MRVLEFIPGSRGFPGFRQNDVAARCSEPPFLTHGGQDDGSYTNSLKPPRDILPLGAFGPGGGPILRVVCVSARVPLGVEKSSIWLKRNVFF